MKKEVKLLKIKAVNSLILSIEHFNRPYDAGRTETVLIFLDHSFEMLLKAAILHRGGKIREPRDKNTLGFDACVRKALSDGSIKFLKEEQVLSLQSMNSLRDAAQHHLLDLSEQHLYFQAQIGLTLFKDIYEDVFDQKLATELPKRVLPLSTTPPADLSTLFLTEVEEIKKLLYPRSRHVIEAKSKLRALAITEGAIQGEKLQPSDYELDKLGTKIKQGKSFQDIFPGIALLNISANGYGPSIDLRITKSEGIPISLVPEGTPDASVVAVRKIDSLSYYNLGHKQMADKLKISPSKLTAVIYFLNLKNDPECYKNFVIGKTRFNRYSQKAILKLQETIMKHSMKTIWQEYKNRNKQ